MGIRYLNSYLREKCPNSIRVMHMSNLSGKQIAIDISIYLYKYEADDALLENMYQMLSIFRYYNIIPIFIFDGKPPPEKRALLIKRKEDKKEAQQEYDVLKKSLENNTDCDDAEKQDIINTMDQLKKQIVNINRDKIELIKSLIRAYGGTYYDAPGEADELCALLVLKKIVWACLSEDMDMFVYGCARVLRYFSLINHSIVLYNMKGILEDLSMSHTEFKEVCVLSGTDYNIHANTFQSKDKDVIKNINVSINVSKNVSINVSKSKGKNADINLYETLKLFHKYKDDKVTQKLNGKNKMNFYNWLQNNTDYISDLELLERINKMFELTDDNCSLANFKYIKIINGPIDDVLLHSIMREDGFIFIN